MNISDKVFTEVKTLAAQWQKKIQYTKGSDEKNFHKMMQVMLQNPLNKIFLIELLDQSFRSSNPQRVAEQLQYIFSKYENLEFFTSFEKILIWAFRNIGVHLSSFSIPIFVSYLRNDLSTIIIKGEEEALYKHIQKRRDEGTRVNLNIIGESVLGENEAHERIQKYIKALEDPYIDYLSIKISTIFSQITPLAFNWSVNKLSSRLQKIYQAAINNPFINKNGEKEAKFVNLDMEEYRDLRLTIATFKQTLGLEKFKHLYAGIVIQTYLPESLSYVKSLASWAKLRVQNGGSPIKIRLVKGANQEMELTEASLRHWACVTYHCKQESDANYKYIMNFLFSKDVAPYVHIGIASHNLFDHALARLLAKQRGLETYYSAEMLEGMSEAAYHLLKAEGINVLLYAPIATKQTFTNAIAYLIRSFDENTAKQNFLRHSFGLKIGSKAWKRLVISYEDSITVLDKIAFVPKRTQDRNKLPQITGSNASNYTFENVANTDFTLENNQIWAREIRNKWKNINQEGGFNASVVISGETLSCKEYVEVFDKSQLPNNIKVGSFTKADKKSLDKAIFTATKDPDYWRETSLQERQTLLMEVAINLERKRADLIGIAAAELGKVFTETDVEVSEAIDFLNFYPTSLKQLNTIQELTLSPKGVGLVISPWNFPIAIPAGGVAAALSAGNCVIFKPSSDAVLSAYLLCQCFWEAGISKNTLQFVPCSAELANTVLISNNAINFTIFTGSEKTAYRMLETRPDIYLSAETGGKNATIVTALADKDQAIKNVVASAFNNSGQKCSATSLLILEEELYEDENFKQMLLDATTSLNVGSVWDLHNRVSTLYNRPSGPLKQALNYLEDNETWLIKPTYVDNNPYLLQPCIRWGTQKGDFCHTTELFGPVLSVMKAKNLKDAIDIVNATGYGLTAGLESLDQREQKQFKQALIAGNLYINRMTTGAIVRRQPFGGMRKSAIGSGKKAGGFNYISQFINLHCKALSEHELKQSFQHYLDTEFLVEHDYSHIRGESNIISYKKVSSVLLRVYENDLEYEVLNTVIAIKMVGITLHISFEKELKSMQACLNPYLSTTDTHAVEKEPIFIAKMKEYGRVRILQSKNISSLLYTRAAKEAIYLACDPFVSHARIELMHYFIEQSISNSYHRYGNLGIKSLTR